MAFADLAAPLATWPIAAAVEFTALAGAGVLTGVATAIAAAIGCAVLAAAFAAAAAVAVSVVAAALSLPSLSLLDDVFAGAADVSEGICVGLAGGGAPFGAAGFACVSELFGPLAAFVLVVALLAGWALALPPVAALEDVLPALAGGGLLVPPCGGADVVTLLCVAAEFELASAVAGWSEVLLCRGSACRNWRRVGGLRRICRRGDRCRRGRRGIKQRREWLGVCHRRRCRCRRPLWLRERR